MTQLEKLRLDATNALNAFLAHPTLENADKASSLIDFYSDCFKDENGIRPRWMWEKEFASFTPEHKRVWDENFKRYMGE